MSRKTDLHKQHYALGRDLSDTIKRLTSGFGSKELTQVLQAYIQLMKPKGEEEGDELVIDREVVAQMALFASYSANHLILEKLKNE